MRELVLEATGQRHTHEVRPGPVQIPHVKVRRHCGKRRCQFIKLRHRIGPSTAVDDEGIDATEEAFFKILRERPLPPHHQWEIRVQMSEHDVLQLGGVTVFQNKRNLLAANRLPTLIGMAERIDPSPRPRSLPRNTDNQKRTAGVQRDNTIQSIHIRLNGTRVFTVDGKVQE